MNLNINVIVQSGIVKWPALRYDANSRPEFRFVLYRETTNAEGHVFPLSIPCCSPGTTGERLAEELNEGEFIVVTVGELVYRKRQTKAGELSRLEILVWRVQMGETSQPSASVAARSEDAEGDPPSDEADTRAEPNTMANIFDMPKRKPRKRPYPKAALQGGFLTN